MKKIILPLFFLLFCDLAYSGTIQMTTVLPPPINTFSRLLLTPQNVDPNETACTGKDGTVFIDSNLDLAICFNMSILRSTSPWGENGNDIYLKDADINQDLNVGIGTANPTARLHLIKANGQANKFNNFKFLGDDGSSHNLGMIFTTTGEPQSVGPVNWANYIEFQVGTGGPKKIGRVLYADRKNISGTPWAPTGIMFQSIKNSGGPIDMWVDGDDGQVGIGVGTIPASASTDLARSPNYQLEVYNGNLKVNNLYLIKPNETESGILKVKYDSSNGGGYYAVLAP